MKTLTAEVVSIGDEMTSGQRLDTNSRWISQRLGDLGVRVAFHSTVGDTLEHKVDVFRIAANRADVVVMTGGLGPTADDLTRQALSEVTQCPLEFHAETLHHIQGLYARFQREMPARNKAQAYFPQGSQVVPNPEGTAPGIDLIWQAAPDHATRFFCLPGVPAEMFQMWKATVGPAIQLMTGNDSLIHHHVLHCFGTGESRMEEMLGDLTKRGRDPIVGITASRATISLRISTRGPNEESCLAKLKPTLEDIDQRLGNLVFGENGMELAEVVLDLLSQRGQTISIVDCGLGGAVAWSLHEAIHLHNDYQDKAKVVKTTCTGRLGGEELSQRVAQTKSETDADFVIGIGPVQQVDGVPTFEAILQSDDDQTLEQFNYAGHTDFRHIRSVKQVLNLIRLLLLTP